MGEKVENITTSGQGVIITMKGDRAAHKLVGLNGGSYKGSTLKISQLDMVMTAEVICELISNRIKDEEKVYNFGKGEGSAWDVKASISVLSYSSSGSNPSTPRNKEIPARKTEDMKGKSQVTTREESWKTQGKGNKGGKGKGKDERSRSPRGTWRVRGAGRGRTPTRSASLGPHTRSMTPVAGNPKTPYRKMGTIPEGELNNPRAPWAGKGCGLCYHRNRGWENHTHLKCPHKHEGKGVDNGLAGGSPVYHPEPNPSGGSAKPSIL